MDRAQELRDLVERFIARDGAAKDAPTARATFDHTECMDALDARIRALMGIMQGKRNADARRKLSIGG